MKIYKAYLSVTNELSSHAVFDFLIKAGFKIEKVDIKSFSVKQASRNDLIIVDIKTADQYCQELLDVKKENQSFLPVLLFVSKKYTNSEVIPECIDDIIKFPVSESEWTNRINTYLKLRERENKVSKRCNSDYKALFTDNNFIMLLVDPRTGNIEDANRAASEFYGYSYSKLKSMKIQQLNTLPNKQVVEKKEKIKCHKKNYFVVEHRLADGSNKTVEIYSGKINHKGKQLLYSIIHDITDSKNTERMLRESQENYRNIIENTPDIVTLIDKNGIIRNVNRRACEVGGYLREEIVGKSIANFLTKEDYFKALAAVKRVFNNKQVMPFFSSLMILKNGKKIPVISRGVLLKFNGEIMNMTIIRDISPIIKTENELRRSEETFQNIFNNSSVAIYIQNRIGKFLDVNKAALKLYGFDKKEDLIGKSSETVLAEGKNDLLQMKKYIELAFKGKPQQFEFWAKRKDGTIFPKLVTVEKGNYFGKQVVFAFSFDITQQKRTEEALIRSEGNYRLLFEQSPFGIFTARPDGKILDANPALIKILGSPSAEATKQINVLQFPPLVAVGYSKTFKKCMEKGTIIQLKMNYTSKWEKPFYAETTFVPLKNEQSKVEKVYTILRDITEQHTAEQLLRASEYKYRSLAETSSDLILTIDNEGKFIYINPAIKKLLGYSVEEVSGQYFGKYVAPEFRNLIIARFDKAFKGKKIPLYEIEILRKDGCKIPFELNGSSLMDANGNVIGIQIIARDITARKKAERDLIESEKKHKALSRQFRLMSDNIPDLVWAKDLEGRFTFVNKAICEKLLIAKNIEEPIGKTDIYFSERQHQLQPKRKDWYTFDKLCVNSDTNVLKCKKPQKSVEYGNIQGKLLYLDVYKAPIFDEHNHIIGTVGHGRIVTKEREAEKNLLLRDKALNSAANAIVITNSDGKLEWVNKAFCVLTGYSRTEAIGYNINELVGSGKQDDSFYQNLKETLHRGKVWKGEFINKRKDGILYEVEEVITPVPDESGDIEHLIGIMTDISRRKAYERELKTAKEAAEESSRLKSAFLHNMNHELRTPMNAIMGFSDLMKEANPKQKNQYATIILNSSEQLLKLIDNVIYLSRLQSEKLPVKKNYFSPAKLVIELYELFNLPNMKGKLNIIKNIPAELNEMMFYADNYKIKQVLTNLTSNAVKYTEEGSIEIGFGIKNNKIEFYVKDTGIGVPEKEQTKIFESFYRGEEAIKKAIGGTGLGLNIAKELIELMDGTIDVKSIHGKGSRFYFQLPFQISTQRENAKIGKLIINKKTTGELNVLVVEDEPTSYLYVDVLLRDKVKRIDHAQNGKEAVEMANKFTYDIVLMDIKMPVMNGMEATKILRKQFPQLIIIAQTAFSLPEQRTKAIEAGCNDYLTKPIKKEKLLEMVNKYAGKYHRTQNR